MGTGRRARTGLPAARKLTLRDGTRILVRPILPVDKDRLREGFARLSQASRYRRFMTSMEALSDRQLRYFTEIDYSDHMAWVAMDPDHPAHPGLGVARYIRLAEDPTTAEAAVTVLDEQQGRGMGTPPIPRVPKAYRIPRPAGSSSRWPSVSCPCSSSATPACPITRRTHLEADRRPPARAGPALQAAACPRPGDLRNPGPAALPQAPAATQAGRMGPSRSTPKEVRMQAAVGDRVVIKGRYLGESERGGEIIALEGPDGQPPWRA